MNNITSSTTFCVAPWTTLNIDQTGRVMPCMHSGYEYGNLKNSTIQEILNGSKHLELKTTIAQGQWHTACDLCKQSELSTGASARTVRKASQDVLDNINQDINFVQLEHLTVNWSNLCNLTCVYCNAETSTAWQALKGIPINYVRNSYADLIQLAKDYKNTIVGLTLGGGEPLLQKSLDEFLLQLNPDQTQVLVTTNLSIDIQTNKIYQILKHWPKVDWQVSFDTVNKDKFEYIRKGANWDLLVNNIKLMRQEGQKVYAHPAYSIYCALELDELYQFCDSHNLHIFWCDLMYPWDLDVRRYPLHIRQRAVNNINLVIGKYKTHSHLNTDTLERYRKQLVDNSYITVYPEYIPNPVKFHSDVEKENKSVQRFIDLWPEFI